MFNRLSSAIPAAVVAVILACPSPANAEGTVYGFDLRGDDNMVTFPATDPSSLVVLNATPDYLTFAMDFSVDGSVLHVVDRFDFNIDPLNPRIIGTVDPADATFTPGPALTGDFDQALTESGLSVDPTDGTLYLSGSGDTGSNLYTLDPDTGITTLVGPIILADLTPIPFVIDLAVSNAGDLYAHSISTDSLYLLDKTTGIATLIGTHGLAANFAQGMDFDPDTDILYAAIYTGGGTGSYGTWDTTTGEITEILDLPSFPMPEYELEMAIRGSAESCVGDFTGNGTVNAEDLAILLGGWGTPAGDLNGDNTTDATDLALLLGNWGECL